MNIRGLYKTSLVDFPGKITSVIFTGGCNLRCGYCHNPDMVLDSGGTSAVSEDYVFEFLSGRKNLIDGVTVTGGEPSLQPDLPDFLGKIRDMGFLVKLDTNGFSPEVVKTVTESGLADYIALDVKSSPEKYSAVTGRDYPFCTVLETINILKNSCIDFELRTTCIPDLVTSEDIVLIGEAVGKVKRYSLQQFVNTGRLIDPAFHELSPYPVAYLESMRSKCLEFAETCIIRGV
jgi:pyruvate formate lyase activating enzyme